MYSISHQQQQQPHPQVIVHHPRPDFLATPQQQQQQQHYPGNQHSLLKPAFVKTEEEQKNDLINDTISKLKDGNKCKAAAAGNSNSGSSPNKGYKKEPLYVTLREKRLANQRKRNAEAAARAMPGMMVANRTEEEEKNALALPLLEAAKKRQNGGQSGQAKKGAKKVGRPRLSDTERAGKSKKNKKRREEWMMMDDGEDATNMQLQQQQQQDYQQQQQGMAVGGRQCSEIGRPGSKREKVCCTSNHKL